MAILLQNDQVSKEGKAYLGCSIFLFILFFLIKCFYYFLSTSQSARAHIYIYIYYLLTWVDNVGENPFWTGWGSDSLEQLEDYSEKKAVWYNLCFLFAIIKDMISPLAFFFNSLYTSVVTGLSLTRYTLESKICTVS